MKQKKKAGLTMVELLCALAVLLLVAACMVVGVSLAVRSYDRSLASSEAQVLCATLQTTVSDELRYSGTLFYDQTGRLTGFFSQEHGGEDAKSEIAGAVDAALAVFTDTLTVRQQRAADVFARIFRTITVCVVLFAAVMLLECMVIRRGIVHPLLEYNESIHHGVIAPIHGVAELRTLAETYNSIYTENEEREMLMKHQAEHDPLTELLNRRSFDKY